MNFLCSLAFGSFNLFTPTTINAQEIASTDHKNNAKTYKKLAPSTVLKGEI